MYIYKITNTINSKIYVGQTTRSLNIRLKDHIESALYDKSKGNSAIHSSIKKHGKENFKIELIEETNDLNNREIFWISELKSLYPNGYNILPGGKNNYKLTEHNILKISKPIRAINSRTGECFYFISLTLPNDLGYSRGSVSCAIKYKKRYKGYYWTHCTLKEYLKYKKRNNIKKVPKFYGRNENNEIFEFFCYSELKKHNLVTNKVISCLKKYKGCLSHKKWVFSYRIEEIIMDFKDLKNENNPVNAQDMLPQS